MDQPVTLTLRTPIQAGKDKLLAELTFRRGKLSDLRGVSPDSPSVDDLMLIASRLSGEPVGIIGQLEEEDASEAMAIAIAFFRRCLQAGSARSQS